MNEGRNEGGKEGMNERKNERTNEGICVYVCLRARTHACCANMVGFVHTDCHVNEIYKYVIQV